MLKHASTRWLSTGICLERLLENCDLVEDFFKSEATRTDLSLYALNKVQKIREAMESRSGQLYFMSFHDMPSDQWRHFLLQTRQTPL